MLKGSMIMKHSLSTKVTLGKLEIRSRLVRSVRNITLQVAIAGAAAMPLS
jgi:hypothetical protein